MPNNQQIFVYGTLRVRAADDQEWYLHGFRMRNAGAYPFIEYTGVVSDVIVGQLLDVKDAAHLRSLDAYEGVERGLYVRRDATVYSSRKKDGDTKKVMVYVKGPLWDYEIITSGDWLKYQKEKVGA